MSKIYEALQNVHREKKGKGPFERIAPVPFAPLEAAALGFEDEMLSLYKLIEALLPHFPSRIIQFIGAREGEGTSTVSRQFARAAADLIGHSVLLVDADRLNHSQDLFFDIQSGIGWVDALRSGSNIEDSFQRVGQSKLFVSRCGNSSVSTPEIFNSSFDRMCEKLRANFELVLIDSAPLAISPDGLAIASKVDGVVLVVEAEGSRWQTVRRLRDSIYRVGGSMLGVVLNKRRYYIPQSIYRRL
ncbi:MAG: CpsD/CapB family tyrosine-protein kinase [Syntrophobacteraceae bacterium]|nr:CpsD/CapB family tyrosine-protein kinase [Syntrophobacteraceae bacterium]